MADAGQRDQDAEHQAEGEHQQQAARSLLARSGELLFSFLQLLLAGSTKIEQGVIQFAAAGDDFALEKIEFSFLGVAQHRLWDGLDGRPEFAQAFAQSRQSAGLTGIARQKRQCIGILSLQVFELSAQDLGLGGSGVDEVIADVVSSQPQVAAERSERIVLVGIVPVDFEMLFGNAELNAVGFRGGEHKDGEHCTVTGAQHGAFAMPSKHCHRHRNPFPLFCAVAGVRGNTILAVWTLPNVSRTMVISTAMALPNGAGMVMARTVALSGDSPQRAGWSLPFVS